jgi:hypothetical protein
MSEKKSECEICKEQTLLKLPHFSGTIKKESTKKVGSIVESYIEEAREEIKRERKEISKLEYKPE